MDKRYQVFVSSTYADLKEERSHVIQALIMEMDCIPAGMELFPALDEEQFEFIKKVIDDCDYYLLIIGGRYGSITEDGVSYTEKEFDYAVRKGLKVIALVHEKPEDLPAKKTEQNPEARKKLDAFRNKVMTGRLVRFWKNPNELAGLVALNLQKTIKMYPAIGWVRGDKASDNEDLLRQLNQATQEISALKKENESFKKNVEKVHFSQTDARITLIFLEYVGSNQHHKHKIETSWNELFEVIGYLLIVNTYSRESRISDALVQNYFPNEEGFSIEQESFNLIQIQFIALDYIEIIIKDSNNNVSSEWSNFIGSSYDTFWKLTENGTKIASHQFAIKNN